MIGGVRLGAGGQRERGAHRQRAHQPRALHLITMVRTVTTVVHRRSIRRYALIPTPLSGLLLSKRGCPTLLHNRY
jgi:hypothetical protein